MENSNKALAILRLIKIEYQEALREFIKADSDYAATIAAHNVWKEYNPDSGLGMTDSNPYNIDNANKRLIDARDKFHRFEEVYEYAIETFLNKISKDSTETFSITKVEKKEG